MRSEHAPDRLRLGRIVGRRAGAVGIDVVDVALVQSGIGERGGSPSRRPFPMAARCRRHQPTSRHRQTPRESSRRASARVRIPRTRTRRRLRREPCRGAACRTDGKCRRQSRASASHAFTVGTVTQASVPPVTAKSTFPLRTISNACAIAWLADAQALTTANDGPVRPNSMPTWQAGAFAITRTIVSGCRRGFLSP